MTAHAGRVIDPEIVAPSQRGSEAMALLQSLTASNANLQAIDVAAKLYREERDDARRMAFDAAMADAQSEMVRIATNAVNSQTHSKYATYAAMDRAIRPIYTKHGFGLSFNAPTATASEWVRITCRVSHRAGWGQDYSIDMPADGKGAKGGDVMTKTHAVGSASAYGMRYLLRMIFNLAIGDDDDGNAASGRSGTKASAKAIADVRAALAANGRDENKACAYLKLRTLDDATADDLIKLATTMAQPAKRATTPTEPAGAHVHTRAESMAIIAAAKEPKKSAALAQRNLSADNYTAASAPDEDLAYVAGLLSRGEA